MPLTNAAGAEVGDAAGAVPDLADFIVGEDHRFFEARVQTRSISSAPRVSKLRSRASRYYR